MSLHLSCSTRRKGATRVWGKICLARFDPDERISTRRERVLAKILIDAFLLCALHSSALRCIAVGTGLSRFTSAET